MGRDDLKQRSIRAQRRHERGLQRQRGSNGGLSVPSPTRHERRGGIGMQRPSIMQQTSKLATKFESRKKTPNFMRHSRSSEANTVNLDDELSKWVQPGPPRA